MIYERIYSDCKQNIPLKLVLENKEREFTVFEFYENLQNLSVDDLQFMYVLKESIDKPIIGFVWGTYCPMVKAVYINAVAIHKDYRDDGKTFENTILHFKKKFCYEGYKTIKILTQRPSWYLKNGWERSKYQLLELSTEKE